MKFTWVILLIFIGCLGQGPSTEPLNPPPRTYTDLTDDEILELIPQQSPVILYFYSPTCSTCLEVKPLLEELEIDYNLTILWVSKQKNQAIFDLYRVSYFPTLYVSSDSEVLIKFDKEDNLKSIYSLIMDKTITGMHKIDTTIEGTNLVIPTESLVPDTLYYVTYDNHRIFVFISPAAKLFVFSGSQNCESHWFFLKKDILYDGENLGRWNRRTLAKEGGICGELVQVPYSITGTAIIIATEDIV